jgi:hypothetical protein
MAVSRFFTFLVRNNFSENRVCGRNLFCRKILQYEVGGYMKGGEKKRLGRKSLASLWKKRRQVKICSFPGAP